MSLAIFAQRLGCSPLLLLVFEDFALIEPRRGNASQLRVFVIVVAAAVAHIGMNGRRRLGGFFDRG